MGFPYFFRTTAFPPLAMMLFFATQSRAFEPQDVADVGRIDQVAANGQEAQPGSPSAGLRNHLGPLEPVAEHFDP